jgi:predicted acylesterase/phospholipase RssA
MPPATIKRQVRLGLVLNGGVSLAVWIGGVTHELDNLRRAAKSEPTADESTLRHYRRLLELLEEEVVIDVIAGASAGGINGVLLATSIYTGQPLPDLRETWISIGDFGTLLRSPRDLNPPSLMMGDKVILAELQRLIDHLYTCGASNNAPAQPLYLYITATDLFGHVNSYHDTTGRDFEESDARRRLTFQSEGGQPRHRTYPADLQSVMRPIVDFSDEDAPQLLALAARSSSSFPVAFEARELSFVERAPAAVGEPGPPDGQPKPKRHWMIDGGILDNQPFNPVLDRISFLSADVPVKRIVTYVVPYVNEPGTIEKPAREFATAMETQSAAGRLPRDLPKLESLERVTAEHDAQEIAEEDRRRLWREVETNPDSLQNAASALFPIYQKTRFAASLGVWKAWAAPNFRPGSGVLAQDPTIDPRELTTKYGAGLDPEPTPEQLLKARWVADDADWDPNDRVWDWGLAPAERVPVYALLFLRDAAESDAAIAANPVLLDARVTASHLAEGARKAKIELQDAFRNSDKRQTLLERATAAYAAAMSPARTQVLFRELNEKLQAVRTLGVNVPLVRDLLHLEVVQNAVSVADPRTPFPFDFLFASAGIPNSLGHTASSPQTKLAGMRLSHFAGFLKRSWRANDWLWGRLDGVEHVLRALLDLDYIARLSANPNKPNLLSDFAELAFPDNNAEERAVVAQAWKERLGLQAQWERQKGVTTDRHVRTFTANLPDERDQFVAVLDHAIADRKQRPRLAQEWLDCCRCALAARIQLAILRDDLDRVAVTSAEDVEHGASKSAGSVYWSSDFFHRDDSLATTTSMPLTDKQRVDIFKRMRIGEETPAAESDSRHTIGISAQILGVASAMLAGDKGGLPLPVRSSLATIRGLTLPLTSVARLSAAEPAFGAVITIIVTGLVLWIALSKNALLGAFFPALALLVVVMWLVLFTIATSVFEESLRTWRRILGFAVLSGVPLAFGLFAGYPGLDGVRSWIDSHFDAGVTRTAAVIALLAAAVALLRLTIAVKPAAESSLPARYVRLGLLGLVLVLASVLAWWPSWTRDHLSTWIGGDVRRVLAVVAAALGLTFMARTAVRGVIRLAPTWRRKVLKWYRPIVFAALLTLAAGFIARRWVDQNEKKHGAWVTVADEHKGTILVLILLGTLFAAAVLIENFLPIRRRKRKSSDPQGANPAAAGSKLPSGLTYTLGALLVLDVAGWAFYAGLVAA